MKMSETLVQKLRDVFTEVGVEGSLEDCLDELSGLVARVLSAQGCTILLLSEEEAKNAQLLGDRAGFGMLPGTPGKLRSRLSRRSQTRAKPAPPIVQDSCGEMESMFSTIVLNGKLIGVIHASRPQMQRFFSKDDLDLFSIVTPIITKSIQVIQLQHILKSRFTQVALTRSGDSTVRDLLSGVMQNPNQIARILAKSFYREMLNAGFNLNQIIFAATEVISELSASVRKHSAQRKHVLIDVQDGGQKQLEGVIGELAIVPAAGEDDVANNISA
jgi:L-methionine (R)-S-oxide reductase